MSSFAPLTTKNSGMKNPKPIASIFGASLLPSPGGA